MNKGLLIIGVVLLIAGGAAAGYFISIGETTRLRTYGSEGVAVLGVILAVAGVVMKPRTTMATAASSQFKCSQCGATFGSDAALKSHMKDKHGM